MLLGFLKILSFAQNKRLKTIRMKYPPCVCLYCKISDTAKSPLMAFKLLEYETRPPEYTHHYYIPLRWCIMTFFHRSHFLLKRIFLKINPKKKNVTTKNRIIFMEKENNFELILFFFRSLFNSIYTMFERYIFLFTAYLD